MTKLTLMIINFLVFHLCWLANAFGAAHQQPWLGPAFVFVALIFHFGLIRHTMIEARTIFCVTIIGYFVDSALLLTGVYQFPETQKIAGTLPPAGLLSQWLIFGSLLRLSLDWLYERWFLSLLLGAIGGPLSYLAARSFDAIRFNYSVFLTLIIIGTAWAVMLPIFVYIAHWNPQAREGFLEYRYRS